MARRKEAECPILVYPGKCTGCRTCQVRCSIRQIEEFNPMKSYIIIRREHGIRTTHIELTDDCTWCGYCARFCAYGALELKKSAKKEAM